MEVGASVKPHFIVRDGEVRDDVLHLVLHNGKLLYSSPDPGLARAFWWGCQPSPVMLFAARRVLPVMLPDIE